MGEKSYADGLREYADYIDAHPELEIKDGSICRYGLCSAERAVLILSSHPSSYADITKSTAEIDYIRQSFGPLRVDHVVRKDLMETPTIVDGKVVWALKPEFQAVQA